ncbi:MAG: protein kinase [Verrucomicrobiales bacterium]|nr:protein kinase [Verrucomicrobiales bacterium]
MLDAYEFIRLLGRGGMGAVYQARQKSLDRLVAIKILPPDLTAGGEGQGFHFAERFQREARAMAKLSHPNIVAVYDFGQTRDGQFYFVMEYVEGTDLHSLIRTGKLTPEHVSGWMSQICEALQYAHGKGIVHRDIKPANIMITRDSQVKVADFGLAKLGGTEETKLTMTNMAMGTPDYVAPEALEQGVEVDHRADLYALGVMLYEMLTGKVPRGNWKPPSALVPGLDPRFDELVERAIEMDREERIQQASEIGASLYRIATTPRAAEAATAAEPAAPPQPQMRERKTAPASPPSPAPSVRAKSPAGLIGGLVTACVALGLGGFFWLKPKLFPPPELAKPAPQPEMVAPKPPPSAPVAATPTPEKAAPEVKKAMPAPQPAPSPPTAAAVAPTLPEAIDTAPWADAIDLLPYIDLGLDTLKPGWKRDGTALITEKNPTALVKLPVVAPEEYDLRLQITRTTPGAQIELFLIRKEREFVWAGGAYGNGMFAFGGENGSHLYAHSPGEAKKQAQPSFEEGRTYQVQVSVRNSGAAAYVDGQWVTRLPADLGEMRLPDESPMAGLGQLGLSTYQASFRVDALQLREITGKAKFLRPPTAPAPKPPDPAMTQTPEPAMPPAPALVTPPPAPTDPVSIRLAELEKNYLDAYAAQISPKHDAALAALNASYTGRLDRDIVAASQAGKLDEALALRDELARMKAHGTVPEEDAPELREGLKPLRTTYRSALKTLLTQRDQAAAPLQAAYDRALAAYQDELTRAQNLDGASRVKAVRELAASQRESSPGTATTSPQTPPQPALGQPAGAIVLPPLPPAPPLRADQVLPPPAKATNEAIRAMADWMFRDSRSSLTIAEGPLTRVIKSSAELPAGNLKVVKFYKYSFDNDAESKSHLPTIAGLLDLEEISFAKHFNHFPIETLSGLIKLKTLNLTLGTLKDADFAHLTGLKSLSSLSFNGNKGFTGTGLMYLPEGLTSISLTGCDHLSAEGIAALQRFRSLQRLYLEEVHSVTDDMLCSLAALTKLETLEISGKQLDGTFLAALSPKSLKRLIFVRPNSPLKPEALVQLGRFQALQELQLQPAPLTPESVAALAGLGELGSLCLNSPFNGETLVGVKGFRSLTSLDLDDAPVTDTGWSAIVQAMPDLQSISLNRPAESKAPQNAAAFGEQIGRLKNLSFLSLTGPTFTDDWLLAASRAKNLEAMHIYCPQVTDAGLVHLQDLPLTALRISTTSITDASIPTLKKFPKLIGGYIYFPEKMSPAGIAEVKAHCDNRRE